MRRALVISFSNLTHDARVQRQVRWLQKHFQVTVVAYEARPTTGLEVIPVPRPKLNAFTRAWLALLLLGRLFNRAYWTLYRYAWLIPELRKSDFDLIVANDVESLPLAFACKTKSRVWIDAHEFAPRHFEEKLYWRIFFQRFNRFLCRKYMPVGDWMTTVSEGLRHAYAQEFRLKPAVLTNATRYHELAPRPTNPERIRIIHHGGANPSRHLELLIEMMAHLDNRFTLDFMLITPALANAATTSYVQRLKSLATDPRITFQPPVPSDAIVEFIHQYDIGIFVLPPVNFNYANTLPNKLFDFIQARLGIAIGPTAEMASVVKQFNMGVVADSFEPREMAARLNALTAQDIDHFKLQAHQAARLLSAEQNELVVKKSLQSLGLLNSI